MHSPVPGQTLTQIGKRWVQKSLKR